MATPASAASFGVRVRSYIGGNHDDLALTGNLPAGIHSGIGEELFKAVGSFSEEPPVCLIRFKARQGTYSFTLNLTSLWTEGKIAWFGDSV